jgi:hypothetical protein
MSVPDVSPVDWKNFQDERLPPALYPWWSYRDDSWSWRPIQSNVNLYSKPTEWWDYTSFAEEDLKVKHPLMLARGGMSEPDIAALEDDTLGLPIPGVPNSTRYPDLASTTHRSRTIMEAYWKELAERRMLPERVVY